jgi:hypothetical protein
MVSSEGEAKRLILLILPDASIRQIGLTIFADAIAEANIYGRDKWAVVHTSRKVRLIVGHIIVCTLVDNHVWMALDKGLLGTSNDRSRLEQSGDWEWDTDGYPEYPSISSRNGHLPAIGETRPVLAGSATPAFRVCLQGC